MKKIHFITFANTSSTFNKERILNEAYNAEIFTSIIGYTENDFDDEYKKLCGNRFEEYPRGYGYWSWKSYLVKKRLEEINYDEYLIYADCGCSIIKDNIDKIDIWLNNINDTGMFSPGYMSDNIEIRWNKGDLIEFINNKYGTHFRRLGFNRTGQINASIIIIKKNKNSEKIINDWYDICNNHFNLINDTPSSIPNNRRFIEHRHDQSVLSLLYKVYGVPFIDYKKDMYGNSKDNIHGSLAPIIETKIKT